jgi:hypothetical protein
MIARLMADAVITPLPPARMTATPTTPDGGLPVDPTLE